MFPVLPGLASLPITGVLSLQQLEAQMFLWWRPNLELRRKGLVSCRSDSQQCLEPVCSFFSPLQYADPVSDLLDKWGAFRSRLFRESCVFHKGNYVKDLSRLGRDLNKVIIIDNSPASYIFHPNNAVRIFHCSERWNINILYKYIICTIHV